MPPETDLLTPELVEGRGLRNDDTNAVVVNARLAQNDPRCRVGSEITLRMGNSVMAWRVVGKVRVPFAPAGAYVSKHYLEQLRDQPGLTNDLRLVMEAKDRASLAGVMAVLENSLGQGGVRTVIRKHMTEHTGACYERIAGKYAETVDTKPSNAYHERPAVLSLLPSLANAKVLDVGCGSGWYAEYLLSRGAVVTAFDSTGSS